MVRNLLSFCRSHSGTPVPFPKAPQRGSKKIAPGKDAPLDALLSERLPPGVTSSKNRPHFRATRGELASVTEGRRSVPERGSGWV